MKHTVADYSFNAKEEPVEETKEEESDEDSFDSGPEDKEAIIISEKTKIANALEESRETFMKSKTSN